MFLTATIDNSLDKSRLDQAIVKLKLVESRQKAFSLIISGKVYLNDKKVVKAGSIIRSGEIIKIRKKIFISLLLYIIHQQNHIWVMLIQVL